MGKYCQQCGTALREADLFCGTCGAQQSISNAYVMPTASVNNTHIPSTDQNAAKSIPIATPKKRKNVFLICGTLFIIAITAVFLFLNATRENREPPFFGLKMGDSVEVVEKKLGTPDDFVDNGLRNFDYYYEVEFLDIDGYVKIHFELDKVESLYFYYHSSSVIIEYDDVVKYYTEKYGEPNEAGEDYYSSGECTFWSLDKHTGLRVRHVPGSSFSKAYLEIAIYS